MNNYINNGMIPGSIHPTQRLVSPTNVSRVQESAPSTSFQRILDNKLLKFSQHAEMRLSQRGIQLQPESLVQLSNAIDAAEKKGAKDSLVVYNNVAFIVNVPSRTVVTAMDGKQMQNNIFTQIDSAIIL
ncbi:TIGR02530 family flagellar biosynthesis protein [Paenibacillus yanchengensis]|uniref:TIGR02530 family flagellar biosynthesis protein n=1 Tax=Paenibacillus yanchengensis TaxID=2035833 RepID=A0ABW4YM57_9BACL